MAQPGRGLAGEGAGRGVSPGQPEPQDVEPVRARPRPAVAPDRPGLVVAGVGLRDVPERRVRGARQFEGVGEQVHRSVGACLGDRPGCSLGGTVGVSGGQLHPPVRDLRRDAFGSLARGQRLADGTPRSLEVRGEQDPGKPGERRHENLPLA